MKFHPLRCSVLTLFVCFTFFPSFALAYDLSCGEAQTQTCIVLTYRSLSYSSGSSYYRYITQGETEDCSPLTNDIDTGTLFYGYWHNSIQKFYWDGNSWVYHRDRKSVV